MSSAIGSISLVNALPVKISDEHVRQIRYLAQHTCIRPNTLAMLYKVGEPQVSRIINGMSRVGVDGPPEDMLAVERVIRQYVDRRPAEDRHAVARILQAERERARR